MIAAWCAQHLLAPFTVEGACNRVVFETWVETCLVPVLQPGQVVILDNATFHKGGCIQQLLHRKRGLNFSICRPIRPTSTKSSTAGLGSKAAFASIWLGLSVCEMQWNTFCT